MEVVSQNYIMYPDLSSIVELDDQAGYIVNQIIKKASTDVPVRIVAQNIEQEFYWKERCDKQLKNVRFEEHGNSYKQAFIERHIQTLIEKFKSQGNLEDLKIELNSVRYDVFRLEILELESHLNMGVVF